MKIRRVLTKKKTFWGIVRGRSFWRMGFGYGFLEIGGSCAGLYLPRRDL